MEEEVVGDPRTGARQRRNRIPHPDQVRCLTAVGLSWKSSVDAFIADLQSLPDLFVYRTVIIYATIGCVMAISGVDTLEGPHT